MSFTQEIKTELCGNELSDKEALAQLGAMILANGSVLISNKQLYLKCVFNQAMIAKRFVLLIKQLYQVECEVSTSKRSNLKKDYIYTVKFSDKAKLILEEIGLYAGIGQDQKISRVLLKTEEQLCAYLAGWFLVCGSINSPRSTNYHCEFRVSKEIHASEIKMVLKKFRVEAKQTTRRNSIIVYVKASDRIADILRIIGSNNGLFMFEDIRIQRDFHNSLIRLDNCEVANEMKTLKAGAKQIEAIEALKAAHRLEFLDQKLIEVANVRVQYPEYSLNELAHVYEETMGVSMSKSGMKHRLDKLVALAKKLKEKEE